MKEQIVIVRNSGVILHSAKDDCLNWSHNEFRPLDLLI